MRTILKDPLVHFLALGLGLFVLFDLVVSDEAAYDSRVINVDRDSLLTFVQYRSRAFERRPHQRASTACPKKSSSAWSVTTCAIPLASKRKLFGFLNFRYFWETGARTTLEGNTFLATFSFPLPSIPLQKVADVGLWNY